MPEVVDAVKRSDMMAGIKSKNTKPEILIRKQLHKLGFRYRLHSANVKGKPDMVFPKYKAVIFVNGCFWHLHNCHLFKWPSTRAEFWKKKLNSNRVRDEKQVRQLLADGWRVLVVWECALKGRKKLVQAEMIDRIAEWIKIGSAFHQIAGEITE